MISCYTDLCTKMTAYSKRYCCVRVISTSFILLQISLLPQAVSMRVPTCNDRRIDRWSMRYSENIYGKEDINASTKTHMPPHRTGCLKNFAKVGQTSGNRSLLKAINAPRKHCESIIDDLLGAPTSTCYAAKAFRFLSHHSVHRR